MDKQVIANGTEVNDRDIIKDCFLVMRFLQVPYTLVIKSLNYFNITFVIKKRL